jgi:hypothetical protein
MVTVRTLDLGYEMHRAVSGVVQCYSLRCFEVNGKEGAQKWEVRVAVVWFGDREL